MIAFPSLSVTVVFSEPAFQLAGRLFFISSYTVLLDNFSVFEVGIAAVFSSECLVDHVYGDKKTAELGSAEFSLFRFGVAILLGNS